MVKAMTAGVERDRPEKSEASVQRGVIVAGEPNAAGDAAATRETEQTENPGNGPLVDAVMAPTSGSKSARLLSPGRFASRVPSE